MVSTGSGMPRARTLAAVLRQLRVRAGLSQRQVAEELGVVHTTVGRWEKGESVPDAETVSALLVILKVTGDEREEVMALARGSAETDWLASGPSGISQQLAGVMECERTTRKATTWSPLVMPGVLQTIEYARMIFSGANLDPTDIDTRALLRMGRRDAFTRSEPAELHALIAEPVIHGGIGGPKVMAGMLRHLLAMGAHDNITIQLVGMTGEWHPGHAGGFTIYDFDLQPSIVYIEALKSGSFLVGADVEVFKTAAEQIRRVAMSPEESAGLIADVLSTLENT